MIKNISGTIQQNQNTEAKPLRADGKPDMRDPKVMAAAKMYEQVFLKQMVGAMRQAVPKSDLVNESMGEKIYKDQMYDQYVEQWSNVGGVGLGDLIYDQILEKFGPQTKGMKPMGPIPVNSGKTYKIDNLSGENKEPGQHGVMLLKFRPQENFRQNFEPMQITSPWEGEVIGKNNLESGETALFLKHPNDMKSTFIFKGSVNLAKNNFGPGENIGTVSAEANEFLWKIEGKKT
jgi:flagellar protein FlgJ